MLTMSVRKTGFPLAMLLLLSACGGGGGGSDGGDGSGASVVEVSPVVNESSDFSLTSQDFTEGEAIPLLNACTAQGGMDISPQFTWSNPPAGTSSYALIMEDQTPPCGTGAEACVHWAVFNIPASTTALVGNEDVSAIEGVVEGFNYIPTTDYAGPCPPDTHTYNIAVYALDATMSVIGSNTMSTSSEFEANYSGSILGQAELTGTFSP